MEKEKDIEQKYHEILEEAALQTSRVIPLSQRIDELSADVKELKKAIFGSADNKGLDSSLILIEHKIQELTKIESSLDERIYTAITQGFCKAISEWGQSHIIEIIGSVIMFVCLMIL